MKNMLQCLRADNLRAAVDLLTPAQLAEFDAETDKLLWIEYNVTNKSICTDAGEMEAVFVEDLINARLV